MKPYRITYEFYYDGELKDYQTHLQLLDASHDEEISGTDFEGLWNLKLDYGPLVPLGAWQFKHKFLQFPDAIISRITPKNCKPWKLVISSEETTVSMDRLMQFNSEDVIQYLKERGITTCPMNF